MNYIEWNNAIAKFFFNEKKSEKEVFLFITKNDIAKIGKTAGLSSEIDEVFKNYIQAIRDDLKKQKSLPLIKRPMQWFEKWNQNFDKEDEYPPYIGYLALFILPLTTSSDTKYNANNFYGRLNDFLNTNHLTEQKISTSKFKKIDTLWNDLEKWSILIKNTELGYFELHPFTHQDWIYVGKPLSQAIFPTAALNKLHNLYDYLGLVPNGFLSESKIREIIKLYGVEKLNLDKKTVELILQPDNEIGLSIIKLIKRNYERWEGKSEEELNTYYESTYVISELRLCFEIDEMNEEIHQYYRLYSTNEFPENLNLERKIPVRYKAKNWSDIINLSFEEKTELIDKHNKWKARVNNKAIRFFINGKREHLSGWVEVPNYIPQIKNIALVNNDIKDDFEIWKSAFERNDFREIEFDNPFPEHSLFEFENPKRKHPKFDEISFEKRNGLEFIEGLKLGPNRYFAEGLPYILTDKENIEKLNLNSDIEDQIKLEKVENTPYYKLSDNVKNANTIIFSESEGEVLKKLSIVNKENYSDEIVPYASTNADEIEISKGIDAIKFSYKPLRKTSVSFSKYERVDYSKIYTNDLILYYLTYKRETRINDFHKAFEELFLKENDLDQNKNLQLIRRLSLRMYFNLGHIEIDYNERKIDINKPRLILLPTKCGRKASLIGGRSKALVSNLFKESERLGLSMKVQEQFNSLSEYSLPNHILLQAGEIYEGERKLNKVAINCGIEFDSDLLYQFELINSCENISDYENNLRLFENFVHEGYKAKIFDADDLKFRDTKIKNIDKRLSLVVYKVNEYRYRHIIWIEYTPFEVDRDWGRYLLLKKLNKQVIFFTDKKSTVTILIPDSVPLPKLCDRVLTSIDGFIPEKKFLKVREFNTLFKVYKSIPLQIAYELCRKLDQPERSAKTNIEL